MRAVPGHQYDGCSVFNECNERSRLDGGEVPGPESGFLNGGRFYDYYETADGRFFSLAGLEPQFVQGICIALENPQIAARG